MSGRYARALMVVGSVAALVAAGCASGGGSRSQMGSGNVIADRQQLMKLQGANMADIQAKLRAGNAEAVAVNADTIALTATHIPTMFPKDSTSDKSRAKPEIWQKWPEFETAAKNVHTAAMKVATTARAKDSDGTATAARELGQACGACHTPFRVPPPQQQPAPRS